ncbi:DUF1684 domain-containing protein [Streptomyces sp. NPDC044571]|uniref:DUF1684 domain-containing protein n=1 Tax=Streptomyces sp. NPDC044571 TaxID=3155371 RepID=UPI0033FD9A10
MSDISDTSGDADDPKTAWRARHRRAAVPAPYGPPSSTGASSRTPSGRAPGPADHPEGRIPAVPGQWRATGAGVRRAARARGGLRPDGGSCTGDDAFADHFTCPFPLPGNALPFPVEAGERRLKDALAARI